MRTAMLLTAALVGVSFSPQPAPAADPPIVYQAQPLGRVLDEVRIATQLAGGDQAVKALQDGIKRWLGEKGFDGLDLNRPIVGYVNIPADPKDTVAVLALPVIGEKEFVEFCERWNRGNKPKPIKGGLYELPALGPGLKAVARVADGYAYIATGVTDPAPALDPKNLVKALTLFDANEQSLLSGRLYFDRLPKELRPKLADALKQVVKVLEGATQGAPPAVGDVWKDVLAQVSRLSNRYLDLSQDAKEAALRVKLDPDTANLSTEFTLSAKPGTALDKVIAGRQPTTNRFAGLLTPDTAAGGVLSLPLFNDEFKAAAVAGLEALRKEAANNASPNAKPTLEELFKGAIRTVKAGEVDIVATLRGPDKQGFFTSIQAISFDDPSALEKELKKYIDAEAPAEFKDVLKWDAAKAGTVSIHTFDIAKVAGFFLGDNFKRTFGDNAMLAFAFAPKAIYVAIGPDAVGAIKDALSLKPGPAPALNVVVNADRLGKYVGAFGDDQAAAMVAQVIGKEDKLISAASLTVTGGKELKVTFTLNLKILPRAILFGTLQSAAGGEARPVEKK